MENNENKLKNVFLKVVKNDFTSFFYKVFETLHPSKALKWNWHIDFLSEYVYAIQNREIKRVVMNLPPRSLKSLLMSVALPSWLLGHDASLKIICVSYSQILSEKHHTDCQNIISSDWYKYFFNNTKIAKGHNTKVKFMTTKKGYRFATSTGGTLTGEGADIIIVDDPQTPIQACSVLERNKVIDWFKETLVTRLNDSEGVIIVVMHRLDQEDLSGFLLKYHIEDNWHFVSIPLLANQEMSFCFKNYLYAAKKNTLLYNTIALKNLKTLQADVGDMAFASQYQQNPIQMENKIIKREWLRRFDLADMQKNLSSSVIYQSWDCAVKTSEYSDYTVCSTWAVYDNSYFLIDVYRDKLPYPGLKSEVQKRANDFGPSGILIEDKASGQQLIQELIDTTGLSIIPIIPRYDKVQRFFLISHLFEKGRVFVPNESIWLYDFEEELMLFPEGRNDDQVDSLTQFLLWIENFCRNNMGDMYKIRYV